MTDQTSIELGGRGTGLRAIRETWARKHPPYLHPATIIRGKIITVFPAAPGVADILDDRTGGIYLCRDVRPERKAVRGATV